MTDVRGETQSLSATGKEEDVSDSLPIPVPVLRHTDIIERAEKVDDGDGDGDGDGLIKDDLAGREPLIETGEDVSRYVLSLPHPSFTHSLIHSQLRTPNTRHPPPISNTSLLHPRYDNSSSRLGSLADIFIQTG